MHTVHLAPVAYRTGPIFCALDAGFARPRNAAFTAHVVSVMHIYT